MNFTEEHLRGRDFTKLFQQYGLGEIKRSGKESKALCPFHPDTTPSFSFTADGLWHCFVCGAGGDFVDFVTQRRGISRDEAIATLRRDIGTGHGNGTDPLKNWKTTQTAPLSASDPAPSSTPPPDFDALWSRASTEHEQGIEYLKARGLWPLPEGIVRFGSDAVYRVCVPLRDPTGSVVGIERRAIAEGANPKIMTATGSRKAGSALGTLNGNSRAWIVEGLTDFLAASMMAEKLGVGALGIPGTTFAEGVVTARAGQFRGKTVFASLDSDKAGREAQDKACKALQEAGATAKVANYPSGFNDLAEIVEKMGADKAAEVMREVFDGAMEWIGSEDESTTQNTAENDRRSPWRSYTYEELKVKVPAAREMLVVPFLGKRETTFFYGPKGHGKSWTAIGAATAAAQGNGARFLNFIAPGPGALVLYVDGEMLSREMTERVAAIKRTSGLDPGNNLLIWTPDVQKDGTPRMNLFTEEGRKMFDDHVADIEETVGRSVELVCLDNLRTLFPGWDENTSKDTQELGQWTISQRTAARSVAIVHHSNKVGGYSGNTNLITTVNCLIRITHPKDYTESDHAAHFDVVYEYARSAPSEDMENFTARLDDDSWVVEGIGHVADELVRVLTKQGLSQRDIALQIKKPKSYVQRRQRALAINETLIEKLATGKKT